LECPVCGIYAVSLRLALAARVEAAGDQGYLLSGLIRELSTLQKPVTIRAENIRELIAYASAIAPANPLEAMDRILRFVYDRPNSIADLVELSGRTDYPIAYAKNEGEFNVLVKRLVQLGFLENVNGSRYSVSVTGWKRVAELSRERPDSDRAFVAMSFARGMDDAWREGFLPAMTACGYKPVRVDLIEHNEKICDRIIAEIRKSGLFVGDFTGHRPNVYFEAGFAKGLGVPVIWTCRKDDMAKEKVHFDTRQYSHIAWREPADLKRKLINRIEAMESGPHLRPRAAMPEKMFLADFTGPDS